MSAGLSSDLLQLDPLSLQFEDAVLQGPLTLFQMSINMLHLQEM